MIVDRVEDPGGRSRLEPPFDEAWDDLTKLRWHAAVVAHDTGLAVDVYPQGSKYGLNVGRWSVGCDSFHVTWRYLSGVNPLVA